jgi:RNA polymerase primary sigma factor
MYEEHELQGYFDAIHRTPRLTPERERELGRLSRAGDEDARGKLIEGNLGFVPFYAKPYRGRGLSYEDLISCGNLGLVEAARTWNPDHVGGSKFSTYAKFFIKKHILKGFNESTGVVRLPINLGTAANSLRHKLRFMKYIDGETLSDDQVVESFGDKYQHQPVRALLATMKTSYCNTTVVNSDGESRERCEGALVVSDRSEDLENSESGRKLKTKLKNILSRIRYGDIVIELFGIDKPPKSYEALAGEHGVTQQSVHSWKNQAFERFRKRHDAEEFLEYVKS